MNQKNQSAGYLSFFKVVASGQAYANLFYLLAAFPFGMVYFVFLISGLSTGISLLIVWVGIPVLLLVGAVGWLLARFEHLLTIHWLKEDLPAMKHQLDRSSNIWKRIKDHISYPVTWKSLIYLILKFPLGLGSFIILVPLIALTLAFLSMPITYQYLPTLKAGLSFGPGLPAWEIDSLLDALVAGLIGLILWPITLHITNGLAWVHAKFARVMLSNDPLFYA